MRLVTGILQLAEHLLQVEDPVETADAILVLAGGDGGRERHAAELYHQGYAPFVVIPLAITEVMGHTIHLDRLALHHLRQAGVPDEAIQRLPERVKTTHDEASQFARFAQSRSWGKMIVVSDAYHSRRAALTFRKALDGFPAQVMMSPCERRLMEREDLTMESKLLQLFFEWVKLLYYFARGRLAWNGLMKWRGS